MAQVNRDRSDSIENTTFPLVREQLNDTLEAIFTINSGNSAPSNAVEHEPFINTSNSPATLEIKTSSGYITLGTLDPAGFKVGGVTPIANGGTGQTTIAEAIAALLPSQSGNADKALVTNGTSLLWSAITTSSFTKYTFAGGAGTGSTRTHTWTKPSSGSTALVFIWGGGGAGAADNGEGGGGGAGSNCGFGLFPLTDLGGTETITLGQGGQATADDQDAASGTNSTFGSHLTSYGGVGGDDDDGRVALGSTPFGQGHVETLSNTQLYRSDDFQYTIFSGGNGGQQRGAGSGERAGGNAFFGGAGGGSCDASGNKAAAGGTSIMGGNGGAANAATTNGEDGAIPGGGGGAAEDGTPGNGGNGECWVIIL